MIASLLRANLALQVLIAALLATWLARGPGEHFYLAGNIAIAVLGVALLHPLFVCTQFLIARLAASPVPDEHRLSLSQALATLDAELDASVRAFCWAQPFLWRRPIPQPQSAAADAPDAAAPKPLPILFIHGYFCNQAVWQPLMAEAARRGHACAAVNLEPVFAGIDDYAPRIEAAFSALLAAQGATCAAVVAHSMGGLAARAWMRQHGHERVARLVTIGTPHAGTVLAAFASGANGKQMRRGSLWTATLAAAEPPERRARISAIWSHHDNVVAPQSSGALEGAHNLAISGHGHVSMVYSAQVHELVFAEIGAPVYPVRP